MIYIANQQGSQDVYIPTIVSEGITHLRMHNIITNEDVVINITNSVKEDDYVKVTISIPAMDEGEWEYHLMQGDIVVGKGLAIIGEYKSNNNQYNYEQEYRQYED